MLELFFDEHNSYVRILESQMPTKCDAVRQQTVDVDILDHGWISINGNENDMSPRFTYFRNREDQKQVDLLLFWVIFHDHAQLKYEQSSILSLWLKKKLVFPNFDSVSGATEYSSHTL